MSLPLVPIALFAGDAVSLVTPFGSSSFVLSPGVATARYQLRATGHLFANTGGGNLLGDKGDWVLPNLSAPKYECFATLNSGVLSSGSTGVWLALTADANWTVSMNAVGIGTAQITVQIRLAGTTTVLATAVVTLTAEVGSTA
jgi:hypothetical protein